jgi:hypothetical protein
LGYESLEVWVRCPHSEDAMKNYINELIRINGNWEQCFEITQNINEEKKSTSTEGGMGVAVSTLYNADNEAV